MKKIFILFSLIAAYMFSNAQSLSVSPSTVGTGDVITITGVNETSTNNFLSIQFDYFNSSTSSPGSNYMNYINLSNGSKTQNYSPGVGTPTPTKYTFTITNTASAPVTVNVAFNCTISGLGGNITKIVTLTVNPTPAQTTFYNVAKSGVFTKNNCGSGTSGSNVTYTVPANTYSASTQAAADQLAVNAVNANGQAYANANGQCLTIYYSAEQTGLFTKNDCTTGGTPPAPVQYTKPAGAYTSTISQQDADSQASAALAIDGQSYANANSSCTYSPSIQGPAIISRGVEYTYNAQHISPNDILTWTLPSSIGTITSGQNTQLVTIETISTGTQAINSSIKLNVVDSSGNLTTISYPITLKSGR